MSLVRNDLQTLKTFFANDTEVRRRIDYIENFNYDPLATIGLERHTLPRVNSAHPEHYAHPETTNSFIPIYQSITNIRNTWKQPFTYTNGSSGLDTQTNPFFMPNVFFSDIQFIAARPETNNEALFHFKMIYHTGMTHIGSCWVDFYVGHDISQTSTALYFWYTLNDFEIPNHRLSTTQRIPCNDHFLRGHSDMIMTFIQRKGTSSFNTNGSAKRGNDGNDDRDSHRLSRSQRLASQFFCYY